MQALFCSVSALDLQAESEGFSHFHLYVCAAFLIKWRKEILSMVDFQVLTISCVTAAGLREEACVFYMWPSALPTHACITGQRPGRHLPRDYWSNWPSSGAASAVTDFTGQRIHHTSAPAKLERSITRSPFSLFHAPFRRISTPQLHLWFSHSLFVSLSGWVEKG